MSDHANEKITLTEREAAAKVGISADLLFRIRTGQPRHGTVSPPAPPFARVGRTILYRPEDLDAWLKSISSAATPDRMPRRRGRPTKAEQAARRIRAEG